MGIKRFDIKKVIKKIDSVTVGDVVSVSQDIFRPERLNFAIIGPFRKKNEFDHLLEI